MQLLRVTPVKNSFDVSCNPSGASINKVCDVEVVNGGLTPKEVSIPIQANTVFPLTLARSPMVSGSYRQASDFLNYSPRLASDILAEQKSKKKKKKFPPNSHDTETCRN